jgi:alpha-tubulin suppressor-like RCC1 family protein
MNSNGAVHLSQLVGIANVTDSGSCFVSGNISLPTASYNTGRILFINDVKQHTFSDGTAWCCDFSLSASTASSLWTWGGGNDGQLGGNSTSNRSSPGTTAGSGSTWKSIVSSSDFNMKLITALKSDGTIWSWGRNEFGFLGDNSTVYRSSPVLIAGGGTSWCKIGFGAGIKTDGTLWLWGNGGDGRIGSGYNYDMSSPTTTAGGGTNWSFISTNRRTAVGIKNDGTLWTWGYNNFGQLADNSINARNSPATVSGGGTTWCFANTGYENTAFIKCDGTLWVSGRNTCGDLGEGSTNICRSSPTSIAGGGTTWCGVSLSCRFGSGVKSDGTIWTWGYNFDGALGTNTNLDARCSPGTTSGGGTNWCQITTGVHAVALKTDGTIWTWGPNYSGQLGINSTCNRSSPSTIAGGFTSWCCIAANITASFGIKTD